MSPADSSAAGAPTATASPTNFLRNVIAADVEAGTYAGRLWRGQPGDAPEQSLGTQDPARVRLRFPPEPNGHLHIGHAKAIFLNFGLAQEFGGVCHLRLDDTNPDKEEQRYVDGILDSVRWLGFDWVTAFGSNLYYASDYFEFMYRAAEALTEIGLAYVDERSPDDIRSSRGDFGHAGTDSPFRHRNASANLARLREMRAGVHPDGSMVLRAKVDMASPNLNMRDPTLYRVRRSRHHRTGDKWCIYPMYTFAHPIEDALERITHSICTLEFEDQRPFYDWLLAHLTDLGLLERPLPRQYEFGRLKLTHAVTSKRKLRQLVDEGHVEGWDDPRLPTIAGLRRRGYTPGSLHLLSTRTGATKTNVWIDYSWLDIALRDDLEETAPRAMGVIDPVLLKLTNWADEFDDEDFRLQCQAPVHPGMPERGSRHLELAAVVWIERDDFRERPERGFRRLFPGNLVRLKYGVVVRCLGVERNKTGDLVAVHASVVPDTISGSPGASAVKVKGAITWVPVHDSRAALFHLFEPLFTAAHPGEEGADLLSQLNPTSRRTVHGFVERYAADVVAETRIQIERQGYFVADLRDHTPARPVFSRITGLRDTAKG
jgi:glutaminyl-tRNA synthetase